MLRRTWVQKDGERIVIDKMSSSHIAKAIRMLQKSNRPDRLDWIDVFNAELYYRQFPEYWMRGFNE